MKKTGGSVAAFIAEVAPTKRQRDPHALVDMMREISGREPELWGTIVGFGSCHYRYPTGNEGDMPVMAFAPRKAASTIYLDSIEAHEQALADLGPAASAASTSKPSSRSMTPCCAASWNARSPTPRAAAASTRRSPSSTDANPAGQAPRRRSAR